MNLNLIFLGGFFPKDFTDTIEKNSKLQVQHAANNFQWAFIKGLEENSNLPLKLITAPFIGWYPKYYKDIYFRSRRFIDSSGKYDGSMIGFLNIPFIKDLFKYCNLFRELERLVYDDKSVIVIYSIEAPYIMAAMNVKKRHPGLRICAIITDLYDFTVAAGFFQRLYLKLVKKTLFSIMKSKIDSFVVLTDKMIDYLKIYNKPSVRIEGLYINDDVLNSDNDLSVKASSEIKVILYSGTLDEKYGIVGLLDAFSLIRDQNYRLFICGGGNMINLVKERVESDKRIKYFGILPRESVSHLQREATLLVNPRNSIGEYNNYSFPSKTMEYFASGTPALIYRLNGIPEEYYDYCYTLNDNKIKTLSDEMHRICKIDSNELKDKGIRAKNFIISKKSAKVQCAKVIRMLEEQFNAK
jgi:glycosyltransferase involved in cell wall biosynthesis